MSDLVDDKQYEKFHQAYQAGANELPPEQLDNVILQAAHKSVQHKADSKSVETTATGIDTQQVKRAWYVPLSYVAILVISLSVVMRLAFEQPDVIESYQFDEQELQEQTVQQAVLMSSDLPMNDQEFVVRKKSVPHKDEIMLVEKSKRMTGQLLDKSELEQNQALPIKPAPMTVTMPAPAIATEIKSRIELNEMSMGHMEKAGQEMQSEIIIQENGISSDENTSIQSAEYSTVMPERASLTVEVDQADEKKKIIGKMIELLDQKKYDELKVKLVEYRKTYPVENDTAEIPGRLLEWESVHMLE